MLMNIVQSHFLCEFNQVKLVYENYQCNAVILETIANYFKDVDFFKYACIIKIYMIHLL